MEQEAEKMFFHEYSVSPWSKKFFKRETPLKCNFCTKTFAYTHLWISHVDEAHPERLSKRKLLRSAVWAFASPCAKNKQEVESKVEQEVHEEVKVEAKPEVTEDTVKCNTNLDSKETTETVPVEPEPAKVWSVPVQATARVKTKKRKRKQKSRGDYINVYTRVRKVKPKSNVKLCQHCRWMKPEHVMAAHCRRNKCPECGKVYKCLGLFSQHRCEARNETDDSSCDVSINIEVKF